MASSKPARLPSEATRELLRALLDRVDGGAAWLDGEGRILFASRPLLRLLRPGGRALAGRPLSLCFHRRKDGAAFLKLLKPRGGPRELVVTLAAKDGPLPVPVRLEPAAVPGTWLLLARDPRPGRYERVALDEIPDAVVFIDGRGMILRASAAARRLAGGDPVGRPFGEAFPLRLLERRKGARARPVDLRSSRTLRASLRCHAVLDAADGGERHLAVSSRPVPGGRDPGAVVLMSDIGDTKALESELRLANEALRRRVEERSSRLLLLYDLARTSNEAESIEQALSLALERICRGSEVRFGQAFLRGRGSLRLVTAWPPEDLAPGRLTERLAPSRRPPGSDPLNLCLASGILEGSNRLDRHLGARGRAAARAGLRSMAAVPIRRGPEVLGALELYSSLSTPFDEDARAALVAAGLQLGEVVDRKRLQQEFAEAVSQEHETIGRELHDSVGQELTGLSLMLRAMPDAAGQRQAATEEITRGLQRVLREVHDLSRGVFPAELRNLGLAGGIARLAQQTARRSGFRVFFDDAAGPLTLDAQTCLQVFRVAQEAVNNAVKYSGGREVRIRLSRRGDEVELDVQDDGRGLPAKRKSLSGSGLRIMRFRAESIGGTLRFRRSPRGGARITCRWKLPSA